MQYRVQVSANVTGFTYVEAENAEDAYQRVNGSIEQGDRVDIDWQNEEYDDAAVIEVKNTYDADDVLNP